MLRQASAGTHLPGVGVASHHTQLPGYLRKHCSLAVPHLQDAFAALLRHDCEELASAKPILARARIVGSSSMAFLHARRHCCLNTMSVLHERLLIYAENHLTTADELRLESGCEALVSPPSSTIVQCWRLM